jgi:hypothetical protein
MPEMLGFVFPSSGSYTAIAGFLKNSRQMSKHSGNEGVIFMIFLLIFDYFILLYNIFANYFEFQSF